MTMTARLPSGSTAREVKFQPGAPTILSPGGEFEGYASLFGVPDLGRDIVVAGAFAETLARRGPSGVRLLWQHDPAEPIGRWLSLAEDGRGLKVRGRLSPGVSRAREVGALMKEGAVDGLSIGFRVVEAQRDRSTGLRRLLRIDLWEISVVTFPLLPGARVATSPPHRAAGPALAAAIRQAASRLRQPAASPAFAVRTR